MAGHRGGEETFGVAVGLASYQCSKPTSVLDTDDPAGRGDSRTGYLPPRGLVKARTDPVHAAKTDMTLWQAESIS